MYIYILIERANMSVPSDIQPPSHYNSDFDPNKSTQTPTNNLKDKNQLSDTINVDKDNEQTTGDSLDKMKKPKRKKKKISKKRCNMEGCRIKLGLCSVDCKCGMKFCPKHFQSYSHNCTFDYQAEYRRRLDKSFGEKVEFAKIDKL